VHSEREEKEEKDKKWLKKSETKEPTDYKLTVVLNKDYFIRNDERSRTIYDFEKKRIFTVDDQKKQYQDNSLYSDLGFRVYELKNREFLGNIMQKAGVAGNPMSAAVSEHLFSLEIKDVKTKIEEAKHNGNLTFSADGKPLMTISEDGEAVGRDELSRFLRFVRYTYGGHPAILRRISALGKIPGKITINRYNMAAEIMTLTLISDQTGPDAPYSLTGSEEKLDSASAEDALARTMLRIKKEPPELYRKQSDETLLNASKAFEKKQYLTSMLSYLEYSLQTGSPLPESFQARREAIQNDVSVREFFAVLTPNSKEEAEKALPVYEKLRGKEKTKNHVLMIFEANIRSSLGQEEKAEKLFLQVLKQNPYITGVYKDLGDIYFNRYLTPKAWQCWDLGRRLAPEFKNFKPIDELEKKLAQEHPEYF
jgi:hypothetical protein